LVEEYESLYEKVQDMKGSTSYFEI